MKIASLLASLVLLCSLQVSAQETQGDRATLDKSPHKSGFVTLKGIKLHYLDWGGNGDSLLLLTGSGDDAHVFDSLAPKFIDHFHVFALTRRGFGESDKPNVGYDTATLVEDVRLFLDAVKIKRVIIVGHSVAGAEMTMFASRYPKRVIKLVYLDAAWDYTCKVGTELLPWQTPPQAAEVTTELPSVFYPLQALNRASDLYHPTYSKVKVPALAIYAPPDRHPEVPRGASAERRKEMDAWYMRNRYPCARTSIEQFREDMRQGKIVEMANGYHYLFLGPAQGDVVRLMREFLLTEKLQ